MHANGMTLRNQLHCRNINISVLTCFAAFLRGNGISVDVDAILAISPIGKNGASKKDIDYIAKRIGIMLTPIPNLEKLKICNDVVLVVRKSRYSFLILKKETNGYFVALPGNKDGEMFMPHDSDIFESIDSAYVLNNLKIKPHFSKQDYKQKFWLIDWESKYAGFYDKNIVLKSNTLHSLDPSVLETLPELVDFTLTCITELHRELCPELINQYGVFRKINLKRNRTIFVDYKYIEEALEKLLYQVRTSQIASFNDGLVFLCKIYTDFQTIHPFLDGNNKIAMKIVDLYLKKWGKKISWENISTSQFHYWTRCARMGHFRAMIAGFRENIQNYSYQLDAKKNEIPKITN